MKKKLAVIATVIIMSFSFTGLLAQAASPTPRTSPRVTSTPRTSPDSSPSASPEEGNGGAVQTATQAPANNYTTPVPAAEKTGFFSTKVSRGGMIGWFLLSVIASFFISFAVGNRFYRLSKKDNHLSAEVRALKRDIDEKMSDRVGGFSEKETDIKNSNRKYFKDPEPEDIPSNGENLYEKWESQLSAAKKKSPSIRTKKVPKPEEIRNSAKEKMQDVIEEMFPFDDDNNR